jgi:hypothetical protein
MAKHLSEHLRDLSVRAKGVEDAYDAAQKEAQPWTKFSKDRPRHGGACTCGHSVRKCSHRSPRLAVVGYFDCVKGNFSRTCSSSIMVLPPA